MTMTLARGIEFRRPVIRSTNTGISTVVLATGQQLESSPIGKEWTHTYVVPYKKNPPLTFYAKTFHGIPILLLLSLISIVVYLGLRGSRE